MYNSHVSWNVTPQFSHQPGCSPVPLKEHSVGQLAQTGYFLGVQIEIRPDDDRGPITAALRFPQPFEELPPRETRHEQIHNHSHRLQLPQQTQSALAIPDTNSLQSDGSDGCGQNLTHAGIVVED